MKQQYYKQCKLESGNTTRVAWIEEHGAKMGFQVALQGDPDKWWKVTSVGSTRITKEQARILERKNQVFKNKLK